MRRVAFLTIIAAGCSAQPPAKPPLDLLVIDAASGAIVERWAAPRLTFDVAVDDSSGRAWVVSEEDSPRVWEVFPDRPPLLWLEIPPTYGYWGTGSEPEMWTPIGGVPWFDRTAIQIDSVRRRGAFSSPRSAILVVADLDTGEPLALHGTEIFGHSVAFDRIGGVGYASGGGTVYAFDLESGRTVGEGWCNDPDEYFFGFGGPSSIAFAPGAGRLFSVFGDIKICEHDPQNPAADRYDLLDCNEFTCGTGGIAVDTSGGRLYIANSAYNSAREDVDPAIPSITFWDRVAGTQSVVETLFMPHGLELSPDGTRLYVAQYYCRRIGVYDALTTEHLYDIPTDGIPWGMDLTADGTRLFVTQFKRQKSDRIGDYAYPAGESDGPCPELVEPVGF